MTTFLQNLVSKLSTGMEGHKKVEAERRKVVVIGGGIAGSLLAKSLQFHADVTLIDPKEYFEISWASLRAMVEPLFGQRSVINHRDYFSNGRIITSVAINITETDVITAEGDHLAYDYLVIATGHLDAVSKSRAERLCEFQAESQKIKSAHSILIVGGGPTGVELAGEIAVDFPEKEVTLVHDGPRLLEFIGEKAAVKAIAWFRSKNVEVKLGQTVDLDSVADIDGSKTYHTSDGETINADCHFLCTGKPLGSVWLKDTYLKNDLDTLGRLMVDRYLRVKGRKNIFAIGDITNVPEIKQGYLAQRHALVAAKNLKLLMAGGKEEKLAAYRPGRTTAIVSLGRRDAVAQLPFTTISGIIPGIIKSRDLFVGRTRKQMGLQPHAADTQR